MGKIKIYILVTSYLLFKKPYSRIIFQCPSRSIFVSNINKYVTLCSNFLGAPGKKYQYDRNGSTFESQNHKFLVFSCQKAFSKNSGVPRPVVISNYEIQTTQL